MSFRLQARLGERINFLGRILKYAFHDWTREMPKPADSDDVNGPFRRDVNKSERSDAGICNDA
jgi:hypothetical protein